MPTWTKKDYEMVAKVLRDAPLDAHRLDTKDGDRDILVQAFARRFRNDNPLFDSTRFDAAVFRGEITRGSRARGGWTTQDYRMIADVLRNSIASDAAKAVTAQTFADRLYYDNPRFKGDLFYKAALGPDYKTKIFKWEPSGDEYATTLGREKVYRREVRVRSYPRRKK